MIDLHMHTKYSDGTDDCIEILQKAEEKKLTYIAITDHNTVQAYKMLEKINIQDYYKGRIIKGIELNTKALNIPIEILGYNIEYNKMEELLKNVYISPEERNRIELKRLVEKCEATGIKLDADYIKSYDAKDFTSKYIHKAIIQNEENRGKIDEEAWNDSKVFYRKYMSNPNTAFYVEMDDLVPDLETAIGLIRKCGGLVFLPHIFEYRDNALPILNYILENYEIDGIECYYTTFSKEQHEYLLKICKEKNLYISGGSDYHGKNKKDVELGIGMGSLKVPEDILKWIN